MAVVQQVGNGRRNWVKETEHAVFRIVSLILSAASAYAVRWFFEPLDVGDPVHYVLWWLVAIGFGLLGFYLSRGIAYRMMSKESIWLYTPLFVFIEFFEILCNYSKAVSSVASGSVSWVTHAPIGQQGAMTFLTYIGWSIIPLVSPLMAVVDMDMVRRRNGEMAQNRQPLVAGVSGGTRVPPGQQGVVRPNHGRPVVVPVPPVQQGAARSNNGQTAARPNNGNNGRPVVVPPPPRQAATQSVVSGGPGAETDRDMSPLKNYYAQRRTEQSAAGSVPFEEELEVR